MQAAASTVRAAAFPASLPAAARTPENFFSLSIFFTLTPSKYFWMQRCPMA